MKTKELKIEAPEGYEVDWDNSSMNTIRFKPSKKKITYEDIVKKLYPGKCYYINNNHTSERQISQLLYLNKLMNVAKYLNGNWKPDFTNIDQYKYIYIYDYLTSKIEVQYTLYRVYLSVCFKTKELALQAIEILGEEEVKKALGIFE